MKSFPKMAATGLFAILMAAPAAAEEAGQTDKEVQPDPFVSTQGSIAIPGIAIAGGLVGLAVIATAIDSSDDT